MQPACATTRTRDLRTRTQVSWNDDTVETLDDLAMLIPAVAVRGHQQAVGDQPAGGFKAAPSERTPAFLVGSKIGKYEVKHILGNGGQARAYLAFDPDLERHVVLKVYHDASDLAVDDVLKEGRALARVKSRYVAQCHGAEHHEGMPYLVLEYVPGRTLVELQAAGGLELKRALELVSLIVEGLEAVHLCGLLHRDLKPSNIIVGDDGIPRLVDFGLAEPVSGKRSTTISGTLAYMAPEQARGETGKVGAASDLFGIGAVLYELLTGQPPYLADGEKSLLEQARAGHVIPIEDVRPELPESVVEVCTRCLASDPADRYASASQLRVALRGCLRRRRERKPGGISFGFRLGKRRFRFQFATTLSVAVVAALLSVTPVLHDPEETHPSSPSPVLSGAAPSSEFSTFSDHGIFSKARSSGLFLRCAPASGELEGQSRFVKSKTEVAPQDPVLHQLGQPILPGPCADEILLRLSPESKQRIQQLMIRVYEEIELGTRGSGDFWKSAADTGGEADD